MHSVCIAPISLLVSRLGVRAHCSGIRCAGPVVHVLVNNVGASPSRTFLRVTRTDGLKLLVPNSLSAARCARVSVEVIVDVTQAA